MVSDTGCAGAADDFTAAIEIEPRFPDSYKRRGQARSAMGDLDGALQDFKSCIERSRDPRVRADCYQERGTIYQKQRDYRKAEAELHVRFRTSPLPCRKEYIFRDQRSFQDVGPWAGRLQAVLPSLLTSVWSF